MCPSACFEIVPNYRNYSPVLNYRRFSKEGVGSQQKFLKVEGVTIKRLLGQAIILLVKWASEIWEGECPKLGQSKEIKSKHDKRKWSCRWHYWWSQHIRHFQRVTFFHTRVCINVSLILVPQKYLFYHLTKNIA